MLISNMGPMLYGAGWGWTPAAIFGATLFTEMDFRDASKLFQLSGGTSPVTAAGDPIGLVNGSGNAGGSLSQATSSKRPTWQNTHAAFDGVDDFFTVNSATLNVTRNATGLTLWAAVRPGTISQQAILAISTAANQSITRVSISMTAAGQLQVIYRRADEDAVTTVNSDAVVLKANTTAAVVVSLNHAAGGASALRAWVDGVEVINATVAGSGNTSDTTPILGRVGGSLTATPTPVNLWNGSIYRCGLAKRACSEPEARRLTATIRRVMG